MPRLQVRTRIDDKEQSLSNGDVRKLEEQYFRGSAEFNPFVCKTTVAELVKKLEDLQWEIYTKHLPDLQAKVTPLN